MICNYHDNTAYKHGRAHLVIGDERTWFFLYHKTFVAVNALSARVTEGVPINKTLSLRLMM